MLIYEILLLIIVLWVFVLLFNHDIFSPSSLIIISYILAFICSIYNLQKWQLNFQSNTFWIIIIGLLSFLITSLIFKIIYHPKKIKETLTLAYITIDKHKLHILNAISCFIFIVYTFYFIKALGGITSLTNFNNAMMIYRNKTLYHNLTLIPSWINLLSKICRALAYIYTYILINNYLIIKNRHLKKNIFDFLPLLIGIIMYLPLTLMSGGRYDLIVYFLYAIILWSIMYRLECSQKINARKVFSIFLIIILILIMFSNFKELVGRENKSSTIDYITEYFGGSVGCFNLYLQEYHPKTDYFGQETFAGIRKLLYQVQLINDPRISTEASLFKKAPNGLIIGNVYTGFRKMYHDFGLIGIIILQSLLAIIFNKLYYNCFTKRKNNKINFSIILISSLSFCLILHSFSEAFYSTVLSFNYLMLFIIMLGIKKYIERNNLPKNYLE